MVLSAGQNWVQRTAARLLGIRYMQDGGTLLVDGEGQPREYDTLNAVYPLRAAANHSESRFDLSIEPTALVPSVPVNRTVFVDAANGSDLSGEAGEQTLPFATIGAAIAAVIVDLSPAENSPALIVVQPGVYSEAPLTLPSWTVLQGADGAQTAILQASTATAALVTLSAASAIRGLTLRGANGVGGIGITTAASVSAGERPYVERCTIRDCETGILCTGSGAELFLWSVEAQRVSGETLDCAVKAAAGALLLARTINAEGDLDGAAFIGQGLCATGSGTQLIVADTLLSFCDDGLLVEDGAFGINSNAAYLGCGNAIHIAATGGTIDHGPSTVQSSLTEDILVESSAGRISLNNVIVEKPVNIAAGAEVFGPRIDRGSASVLIEGSVCVGAPPRPAQLSAGEGCATTLGMTAFHYDGATWVDVTDDLTSPSGSEISVVPGTGPGNYLYIGAQQPFSALELLVTLAQSGGTLAPEYWKDGAGWTAVDWMLTRDNQAYGNELFAATGLQDKRLGATVNWVATTENGVLAYWYRIGVTSVLTTIPRLERVQLHYSATRIGEAGQIEIFGDEEPEHEIDVDLSKWTAEAGASLPNTVTLSYSANVSKAVPSYPSASPRGQSYELDYPSDADTSLPFRLILEASSSNTDTATYVMALYQVLVPPGSTLSGGLTGEGSELKIVTPTGTTNQTQLLTYEILRPEAISGTDRLCLTLRRETNDANDTHTGAVQISKATMLYSRWKP